MHTVFLSVGDIIFNSFSEEYKIKRLTRRFVRHKYDYPLHKFSEAEKIYDTIRIQNLLWIWYVIWNESLFRQLLPPVQMG